MLIFKSCIKKNLLLSFASILFSCGGGGGDLPKTDQVAPKILSVSPAENQLDVLDTDNISISFNEEISNKNFKLSSLVIKKIVNASVTVLPDPISTYNYDSKTKTLTFILKTTALEVNSRYRILIRNIEDTSGNSMNEKTWEFETISNPGGIITPVNGVLGVSPSSNIQIAFTKPMDLASLMVVNQSTNIQNPINFTLTESSVVIANTNILFSYAKESQTATYELITNTTNKIGFKLSTKYDVVLSKAVTNSNGVSLIRDITTSFITGVNAGIGTSPKKPKNVSVSVSNKNAIISWWQVVGTKVSYNLYLSIDSGITYNIIKTNISNLTNPPTSSVFSYSYPIMIGESYLFAITAVETDIESHFSVSANEVSLKPLPNIPSNVQLSNIVNNSVKISWMNDATLKYNIYVTSNNNTSSEIVVSKFGGSSFIHKNIKNNISFTYLLSAVDGDGLESNKFVIPTVVKFESNPEKLASSIFRTSTGFNEIVTSGHNCLIKQTDTNYR